MKKKNFFKKFSLCITVIMILSLFDIRPTITKGQVQKYEDVIKILEIQPGNKTYFTGDSLVEKTMTVNKRKVSVTAINMPTFISMVDEINGKYDVVVIGRKNSGLNSAFKKEVPYRDYTNPFSQQLPRLPFDSWRSKKTNFSTVDIWDENDKNTGEKMKFAEYYSENDITTKRAKEIINMIDTNQLVYMDNSIFNANKDKKIEKTKLYTTFKDKKGENFIKTDISKLNLEGILKKYDSIDEQKKRPEILEVNYPNNEDIANSINRNLNYTIKFGTGKEVQNYNVKLYLDINADGLFKDSEIVEDKMIQVNNENSEFIMNYVLDSRFVGLLNWKLEVTNDIGVKNYKTGSVVFKSLNGAKKIRVLQIMPNEKNLLNLKDNANMNALLKEQLDNDAYDIGIDTKTVREVNEDVSNGKFNLNGTYDMVIVGFADSYANNQIDQKALDEIKSFIQTGQGVMFTHDTMSATIVRKQHGPLLMTRTFRDYIGQSRFVDPFRIKSGDTETDIYKEINEDGELVYKKIPHEEFNYNQNDDPNKNSGKAVTVGATNQGFAGEWTIAERVKSINQAQITDYPYELNDSIAVARTHIQWYQLNLEDPDVVPWMNLEHSKVDSGDSRNNYYTYSKGNITYSGTGHSNGFTEEELKLFVNTIVKANRGANNAPEIIASIPKNSSEEDIYEIPNNEDFNFNITITDYDKDKVKLNSIYFDGEPLDWEYIENSDSIKDKYIEQGSTIKIRIPKEKFNKIEQLNNKIKIEINAEDQMQASVNEIYYVRPIDLPVITIDDSQTTIEMLNGDIHDVELKLEYKNTDDRNKISNVRFSIENYSNSIFNISDIKKKPDNKNQNIVGFKLESLAAVAGSKIQAKITYDITINGNDKDKISKERLVDITVNSKNGKITVKVQDDSGNIVPLDLTGKLSSTHKENKNIFEGTTSVNITPLSGCSYSWPSNSVQNLDKSPKKVISNTYDFRLSDIPSAFDLKKVEENGIIRDLNYDIEFEVNYDNPEVEVVYTVQSNVDASLAPEFTVTPDIMNDIGNTFLGESNGIQKELKYTITPEPFDFIKNINGGETVDNVMFLVDLSNDMNKQERAIQLQNWAIGRILNDNSNRLKNNDTKFGLMSYSNEGTYIYDRDNKGNKNEVNYHKYNESKSYVEPLISLKDYNDACQNLFKGVIQKVSSSNKIEQEGINKALDAAKNVLDSKGKDSLKSIVLVTTGNSNINQSQEKIRELINSGYKIIILDLSNKGNNSLSEFMGENYIVGKFKNNEGKFDTEKDYEKIYNLLIGNSSDNSYVFKDVTMKFNLNNNFTIATDNNGENIVEGEKLSRVDGNTFNLVLNDVVYNIGRDNGDGTFNYTSSPIEVSFTINLQDRKTGKLRFGDSRLNYKKLDKELPMDYEKIPTPVFEINPIKITHGVYNGFKDGEVSIDTTGSLRFAKGSIAPMAATFEYGGPSKFSLELDSDILSDKTKMTAFKIIKDSDGKDVLEKISDIDGLTGTISDESIEIGSTILILYNAHIKTDTDKNRITNVFKSGLTRLSDDYMKSESASFLIEGDLPDLY